LYVIGKLSQARLCIDTSTFQVYNNFAEEMPLFSKVILKVNVFAHPQRVRNLHIKFFTRQHHRYSGKITNDTRWYGMLAEFQVIPLSWWSYNFQNFNQTLVSLEINQTEKKVELILNGLYEPNFSVVRSHNGWVVKDGLYKTNELTLLLLCKSDLPSQQDILSSPLSSVPLPLSSVSSSQNSVPSLPQSVVSLPQQAIRDAEDFFESIGTKRHPSPHLVPPPPPYPPPHHSSSFIPPPPPPYPPPHYSSSFIPPPHQHHSSSFIPPPPHHVSLFTLKELEFKGNHYAAIALPQEPCAKRTRYELPAIPEGSLPSVIRPERHMRQCR